MSVQKSPSVAQRPALFRLAHPLAFGVLLLLLSALTVLTAFGVAPGTAPDDISRRWVEQDIALADWAAATPPALGPGAGGPAAGGPAVSGPAAGGPGAGAPSVKPGFGPSTPGTAANPPTHADRTREMKAYDAASNLFRRNDFSAAVDAFRAFLQDYPDSQLAPNAMYWIGISYANLKDYPRALAAQQQLLAKHPQSSKAPDALLAVAAIEADRGDSARARNTLEDIIARFPASEAAGKARTRLAALRH